MTTKLCIYTAESPEYMDCLFKSFEEFEGYNSTMLLSSPSRLHYYLLTFTDSVKFTAHQVFAAGNLSDKYKVISGDPGYIKDEIRRALNEFKPWYSQPTEVKYQIRLRLTTQGLNKLARSESAIADLRDMPQAMFLAPATLPKVIELISACGLNFPEDYEGFIL